MASLQILAQDPGIPLNFQAKRGSVCPVPAGYGRGMMETMHEPQHRQGGGCSGAHDRGRAPGTVRGRSSARPSAADTGITSSAGSHGGFKTTPRAGFRSGRCAGLKNWPTWPTCASRRHGRPGRRRRDGLPRRTALARTDGLTGGCPCRSARMRRSIPPNADDKSHRFSHVASCAGGGRRDRPQSCMLKNLRPPAKIALSFPAKRGSVCLTVPAGSRCGPTETMHETKPRQGARGARADDGRPAPTEVRRGLRRNRAQPAQAVFDPPYRLAAPGQRRGRAFRTGAPTREGTGRRRRRSRHAATGRGFGQPGCARDARGRSLRAFGPTPSAGRRRDHPQVQGPDAPLLHGFLLSPATS